MNITDEGRAKGHETRRQTAKRRRVKVKEMFEEGRSIAQIARHFKVNPRTISKDLKATD